MTNITDEQKERLKAWLHELQRSNAKWKYCIATAFENGEYADQISDLIDRQSTEPSICCLCGEQMSVSIRVIGNNNANGRAICKCGRHITIHFRRERKALGGEAETEGVFEG